MKKLITWVFFTLSYGASFAQCGSDPAGNTCFEATPICDFNGYCGSTSSTYTVDTWGTEGTVLGCGFLGLSSCPGTGLIGAFCGSIENNSFLSFTASSSTLSFDVLVYNSTDNNGIQIMIFSTTGCSGDVTSYYCDQLVPSSTPHTVSASGLIPGNTYYVMIDGYAGDVCDYEVTANTGVAVPVSASSGSDIGSTIICPGESVVITASGGNGIYTWNTSPDLNATSGATVTATPPATPGTYTYTVSSDIGTPLCPNSGSTDFIITVDNCGCNITANNNGPMCTGTGLTVDLTCSGITGATYSWTGPNGFTSTTQNPTSVAVPSTPGTYDFTVEANDNGTICSATTTVTVYDLPNVNAGSDMTLTCTNTSIVLNGSSSTSGATFSWSGPGIVSGGSTASPTVNTTGNYTLTVTDPTTTCTNTDVVTVNENISSPNANAGSDMTLTCTTTSVVLDGSSTTSGATFSWSGSGIVSGGSTATPTVNATGTYTLTVTDPSNGCTNTDAVMIDQYTPLTDASAGNDMTLNCSVSSVILTGSSITSGGTFSWSGPGIVSGANTATPEVNQAGTYTLTVTDPSSGCQNTDDVVVSEDITTPNADAGSDMIITCTSSTVVLSGSSTTSGATFSWSGPGIVSGGTTASPTVNQAGNYTLTVTNPNNGCSSTDVATVTIDANFPTVDFTADTLTGCETLDVEFTGSADPGMQYTWDFGDGATDNGSTTVSHTYSSIGCFDVTFTVTDPANGCSNNQQFNAYICIVPNPTAAFTVTPQIGCAPLQITMTNQSQDATIYDWIFLPGGIQQTTDLSPVSLTVNESTDVELVASNNLGCSSSTTESILVNACGCTDPTALNYDPSAIVDNGSCTYPPPGINAPNVFTPNNDDNNDFFELNPSSIVNIELIIVNRWGDLMFEESSPNPKWDGKVNSNEVSEGTYFYKYKAIGIDGTELTGHGFLELIRK